MMSNGRIGCAMHNECTLHTLYRIAGYFRGVVYFRLKDQNLEIKSAKIQCLENNLLYTAVNFHGLIVVKMFIMKQ